MAVYTTIDDPSAYFQIATYEGTGSTRKTVTNDGNSNLQPDLFWFKDRDSTARPVIADTSRGATTDPSGYCFSLNPSHTASEVAEGKGVMTITSNGFTVEEQLHAGGNVNTNSMVCWQWKANGGTTANNTDGDLTSVVQVNTTAGFSIIKYTAIDPIEPLDIGHGLGVVPDFWIIKGTDTTRNWGVYHKEMAAAPQNNYLRINSTNAVAAASTWWRNEAPTSTIIKTGEQADINYAAAEFICYAWNEVQGFSKFGKYTGNGVDDTAPSTKGPFIYTGFSPALVIIKKISAVDSWYQFDNKRAGYDPAVYRLYAGETNAETAGTNNTIQFTSNGFKIRFHGGSLNESGGEYVYMAWAEQPFVTSTGIPATAR